jgi:4-diphosphocytidyl-2-C-methyl-D-erythritol kinase
MLEARPPAKVNLTLEVLGRRDDGFHELVSIFMRVGLCDRLTMLNGAGSSDRLTVSGLPGAPTEGNLVLKAVDALRIHAGASLPPLDMTLDKRIPSAAGLGGGSSDAASALGLARELSGIHLEPDLELELARSLGSDVPFFLHRWEWYTFDGDVLDWGHPPLARVTGQGEKIQALPGISPGLGVLLLTPPLVVATGSVFARFDELQASTTIGRGEKTTDLIYEQVFLDQPTSDEILDWAGRLRDANDLWPAAASLEPSLPGIRDALEEQTDRPWLMSGSGPTLFALYASAEEAADAGRSLVESRAPALESAVINAVDLVGPDPKWRHP